MIHIPKTIENTIRQWVANYQEAWGLMEQISEFCLRRFFAKKEELRKKQP